ncbi:amidase [Pseudonocardia sp. GCM10023141]|uniref:amidase n=1 Tax=Pseudonocardia sp. GCM10023141 TaxID=3252653 RepID=UPI00362463A4
MVSRRVSDVTTPDLVELDATELSGLIERREVSCVEVNTAFLDRIDAVNPQVNAIVGLRERDDVLAEAHTSDARLARGERAGWLHGLPVAVKDLSEAAGLVWTAGSPLHRDRIGVTDELHVRRMRAAGAIIIGKTTTPEFGFGSQTYNPVWGTTVNPYDRTRTVGGSSGGAAAALATRMLPVADGSDYMGSLRNPSAFCNVLGLRPSVGRVPGPGFVAQLGEVGPMGRSVDDVAALLAVLAGPDPGSPLGRTDDPARFAGPLDADVRGLRVAWVGDLDGHLATEPGVLELGRAAAGVFESLGAVVEEAVPAVDFAQLWQTMLVWRWWNALALEPLLADRAALKPEIVWEIENGLRLTGLDIHRAMTAREEWFVQVRAFFDRFDAVLAPSTQVFPFTATTPWPAEVGGRPMDSYHRWMETVSPWSLAGTPALGMPAGFDPRGLPTGVQLIGRPGADLDVLRWGKAYETATRWVHRVPPPRPVDPRSDSGE